MPRKFIATLVTASVAALSLSAAPVQADNDKLVKFLAGATALVIIGEALQNNSRGHGQVVIRHGNTRPHRGHVTRHAPPRHYNQGHTRPRHGTRNHRKVLPGGCLRNVNGRRGNVRMLTSRCLNRHYAGFNRLPGACSVRVRANRGVRWGYAPRCLRQHGYRIR